MMQNMGFLNVFSRVDFVRSELQGYGEALDRQASGAGNEKNGTVNIANGQRLNL